MLINSYTVPSGYNNGSYVVQIIIIWTNLICNPLLGFPANALAQHVLSQPCIVYCPIHAVFGSEIAAAASHLLPVQLVVGSSTKEKCRCAASTKIDGGFIIHWDTGTNEHAGRDTQLDTHTHTALEHHTNTQHGALTLHYLF